jgi:hypothetical protein
MIVFFVVLAIVGAIVAVCAAVLCCMWVWDSLLEWRHEPHQRSFLEGFQDARNRLQNDAWWFGESPETMQLLAELARGVPVSDAREKWRRARASNAAAEADSQ